MSVKHDRIVKELNVYVTNSLAKEGHQVFLVQYPLRPPWRPYDFDDVDQVAHKPKAQRFQVKAQLDSLGQNFNADSIDKLKLESILLESSLTRLSTPLAAAIIKDDQVTLLPVHAGWQMRPKMDHLNDAPTVSAVARDKGRQYGDSEELILVQANMRKRETERQTEVRMASWAHLAEQEAKEAWQAMRYVAAHRRDAHQTRELLASTARHRRPLPMDMSRSDYLDALLPGDAAETSSVVRQDTGSMRQAPQPAVASQAGSNRPPLGPTERAALTSALKALFSQHSIASLANIREWMSDRETGLAAKSVAVADAAALHDAILACKGVHQICGIYAMRPTGKNDEYRGLLLDLLGQQETVKRAEIIAAAKERSLDMSDSLYSRVIVKLLKEMCSPSGSNWRLKAGW